MSTSTRLICQRIVVGVVAFLVVPAVHVFAQPNFEAGYIVPVDGDTTRGQIDNRQWQRTPERIRFRADSSSSVQFFSTKGLEAFGVGGQHFRARTVWLDPNPLTNTEFEESQAEYQVRKPEDVHRTFLLVLLDGPVTLYEQRSDRRRFYLKTGDHIQPLVKHAKPVMRGREELYLSVNQYRNHLEQYCSNDASTLLYRATALASYLQECFSSTRLVSAGTGEEGSGASQGLGPDWSITRHRFRASAGFGWLRNYVVGVIRSPNPGRMDYTAIGYALILVNSRGLSRQSVQFGVDLQRRRARNAKSFGNFVYETQVEALSLNFSAEYAYRFLDGEIRPFILGGAEARVPLSYSATVLTKEYIPDGTSTAIGKRRTIMEARRVDPGILFGAGLEVHHWSLAFKYSISVGPDTKEVSPLTFLDATVGYTF